MALTVKVETRIRHAWPLRALSATGWWMPARLWVRIANRLLGLVRVEYRVDGGPWTPHRMDMRDRAQFIVKG